MLSLKNRLFYTIKPLIPRTIQIYLRRNIIRRKRGLYTDVWPIDKKAGRPPDDWHGWPDGKKFALVLTHDVEREKGQKKCYNLINLEKQLGFRSSFNLVPERYKVYPELRQYLKKSGFDVGVHGLRHDGKYYKSKKIFQERTVRINHYLKEWGSVGFSSPSMLRDLEWLHELNIEYDVSTFDTDPFEPQHDGVGSIFPFRVPHPSNNKGYVELPYTLPQDFTLFIIMREKNIALWKQKLDWIAEKGGMALLITHPDYMNFDGTDLGDEEYPVKYYIEFLEYIKTKYKEQYWHALPNEIARFWSASYTNKLAENRIISKRKMMKKQNILMIVENSLPSDTRVRREANTLSNFYNITVIAYKNGADKFHEMVNNIEVFRIPKFNLVKLNIGNKFLRSNINKIGYVLQYIYFTTLTTTMFLCLFIKRRFKIIHVHNPPDTLFFIGLLAKIFSIKFIYDHHDLAPELYLTRFSKRKDFIYKILILCEKLSCKLASVIITTNQSYKQIEIERHNINPDKIYIVRNNPIISECSLKDNNELKKPNNNKKILLFLGSINPQDGIDVLLQSLHYLVNNLNETNFICYIIGDGDSLQLTKQIANELGLMNFIDFKGFISDREKIKEYLFLSDICVEPAPDNELNRHSTFIKIMEYMAASKPIVAFDLKETQFSADSSAILIPHDDVEGFARSIKKLLDEPELREKLGKTGLERIQKGFNWEITSLNLIEAYKSLS